MKARRLLCVAMLSSMITISYGSTRGPVQHERQHHDPIPQFMV